MKEEIKAGLSHLGLRLLREPAGIVMGHDLWRDLGLLLDETPLCIDAGANHGEFTNRLLRLRPAAVVHAFEPSSKCQKILHERFSSETRVKLVASGLGNEIGSRDFYCYANDHLSSFARLQAGAANPFQNEPEVARESVPETTLARYAADRGLDRIDLLKIDTQGYDLRVLQGADELLQTRCVNLVLIELNFLPLYEGQPAPEAIVAFLSRHRLQLVDFYEKCRRDQCLAWCTALFTKIES